VDSARYDDDDDDDDDWTVTLAVTCNTRIFFKDFCLRDVLTRMYSVFRPLNVLHFVNYIINL